jgi:hypothetical protein
MGNKASDGRPFLFSSQVVRVSRGSLAYNKQATFRAEERTKVLWFSWFNSLMPMCSRG